MADSPVSEVCQRAQVALASSPIYALRYLRVDRAGDTILISGCVQSFYQKQLAQELVRAVAEGIPVVNTVDVD